MGGRGIARSHGMITIFSLSHYGHIVSGYSRPSISCPTHHSCRVINVRLDDLAYDVDALSLVDARGPNELLLIRLVRVWGDQCSARSCGFLKSYDSNKTYDVLKIPC